MTLRLVRDEPLKPKRRKFSRLPPVLTPDEETRFRQTMRNLRDAFGTWLCLAAAMNARDDAIRRMMRGARNVSGDMIVRAMRASGLSFDELIGSPVLVGTCRACGAVRRAS